MPHAVIIDDYYARPSGDELRPYVVALRQVIIDNAGTGIKAWFDTQFGLSGDHRGADYFEILLSSPDRVLKFWSLRDASPAGALLPQAFQGLTDELQPVHAVLTAIEKALKDLGWTVATFRELPATPGDLGSDLELIVVDYVLKPGEPSPGVEATKAFLRQAIERIVAQPKAVCPFVVLISENHAAPDEAPRVREAIDLPGAYFRFREKGKITEASLTQLVIDLKLQQSELEAFRKLHKDTQAAIKSVSDGLLKTFNKLELQDLATLQAGQLVQEGEPFGDYVAWLIGQYVSSEMLREESLAMSSSALAGSGFSVMLGHMKPTRAIPELFARVAVCRPQSTIQQIDKGKSLPLRFGDLFAVVGDAEDSGEARRWCSMPDARAGRRTLSTASRAPCLRSRPRFRRRLGAQGDAKRYLLVISQTCDIHHGNITNGEVLCLEGSRRLIAADSEADLLRAAIQQMDQTVPSVMIREGSGFVEVTWSHKDVTTVPRAALERQSGYKYIGRLNEIYAMQAQNSALQELGRVGVPIQPSTSLFYGPAKLKVIDNAGEDQSLQAELQNGMVNAVLINEKTTDIKIKSFHRLALSSDLRTWLIDQCTRLESTASVNVQLKGSLAKFRGRLEKMNQWTLVVGPTSAGAKFYEIDPATGKVQTNNMTIMQVFLGAPFQPASLTNPRLVLELDLVTKDNAESKAG